MRKTLVHLMTDVWTVYKEDRHMKVLVCDDEPLFAEGLKQNILNILDKPTWRVSVDCVSDLEQMAKINAEQYDVAFLDIDMGKLNGIELGRRLRVSSSDIILVFVTNYVQYSLDGYEVHALRYLLKDHLEEKLPECLDAVISAYRKERRHIRFSSENNEIDVMPVHIVYAETEGRHLKIHMVNELRAEMVVSMTMSDLTELLQERGFLRIHQSYLVNMAYIQRIKSTGVWLNDDTKLPISARNYKYLKQEYLHWKGMKRWRM